MNMSQELSFPAEPQSLAEGEFPFLAGLNPAQREAALATEGPVLVLAGAGTGKTRVLTTRLAYLLASGRAMPGQMMAVTFTNKAAHEIRERVGALLGRSTEGWYLGTFHALAARLLRPHAERVGLKSSFTILDDDDQERLIKQLLEAHNIDTKKSPPRLVLAVINRFKDKGLTPAKAPIEKGELAGGKINQIYEEYQARLRDLNACDFGDLMLHQLTLLQHHPDVLEDMQRRFRYILVDEYQDTNVAQYLWLRLLAGGTRNICCVGDEDQSIYGWRGAEVGNILRFEEDFPGAKVIRLEQNYRSTGHILGAAAALIANNRARLGKNLWTAADLGEKIHVKALWDGEEEARFITDEIEALQRRKVLLRDMAIMVRAGFQTRAFEERLIQLGIPYRVLVGARFYERQEIRDAMAYLRLVNSVDDDLAFERIINVPKRGLGPAALQQIHSAARGSGISLFEAVRRLLTTDELKPKVRGALQIFVDHILHGQQQLQHMPHAEVAALLLDEVGYTGMWQADKSPEAPGRLDNLKELVSAIGEFESLPAFLEHVSLVMENTEKSGEDQISIMTLHGAKGLEFHHVFLPGWEEEIFPSRRAMDENGIKGLEEERRLAYVGITRARQKATISYVANRFLYGSWVRAIPSRFVGELPKAHIVEDSHMMFESAPMHSAGGYRNRGQAYSFTKNNHVTSHRSNPPLLEGKARVLPPSQMSDGGFAPGARVFHQKFGYGTVRRAEQDKLEIAFDKAGLKKVMESFVVLADKA
jgi:DNA helicase II / ATP-dependent DNA helicase PcrA